MNILQLCNKVPYPPKDGGCMAMNALTEGLIREGNTVKVLAINTKKHFVDLDKLPSAYLAKTRIESVFIDTDVKFGNAFINLFKSDSYNINRFYSKSFENRLIAILKDEQFDIVQLESLYVSMYCDVIRAHSKAKIVLRAHNIEHQIWERNAYTCGNPIKKGYLYFLAKRLKKYELESLKNYDALLSITSIDNDFLVRSGFMKPSIIIPFGIEFKQLNETKVDQEFFSVFHIGAMDWTPNIAGVNWFLDNVWERLVDAYPQLKFYLAGKNLNANALHLLNRKNVFVVGEVENAAAFMLSKGIMIVPLMSGGGMRVKVIEGFSLGKTIVTTSVGAEGVDYEKGKHCLIANNADEFITAIGKCIENKTYCLEMGKNAAQLANEHYNNIDICKKLNTFYQRILQN